MNKLCRDYDKNEPSLSAVSGMFRHLVARNCKIEGRGKALKPSLFAGNAAFQNVTVPPLQGEVKAQRNQRTMRGLCQFHAKSTPSGDPRA